MNISMEWQDKFDTHIEEIDYQHRYFLKLIKRFSELTEEDHDQAYLKRMLEEISYYAVFHFCSEENIMIKFDYPLLKQHRLIHESLVTELNDQILTLNYDEKGLINLLAFLTNWFMSHTVEEDGKFAKFLFEKKNN